MENTNKYINYSDEEIYELVLNFKTSQNCESAAMILFVFVSNIFYIRKRIDHSVVRIMLRPLYYLGIEYSDDVLKWMAWFKDYAKTNEFYSALPYYNQNAMEWLLEQLFKNKELITECIQELKVSEEVIDM